jgi:hypothetical protein
MSNYSRKGWRNLTSTYRSRLKRYGINGASYRAGYDLKPARGHILTPEHGEYPFTAHFRIDDDRDVTELQIIVNRDGGPTRTRVRPIHL